MTIQIRKYGDRTRTQIKFPDKSRTRQSFVQETMVSNILSRYRQTGVINHSNPKKPSYADFIATHDYKQSIDQINEVTNEFYSLSADTRAKYDNDPLTFLEAVENGIFEEVPILQPVENPTDTTLPETEGGTSPAGNVTPETA